MMNFTFLLGPVFLRYKHGASSGGASSEKSERSGGGGILTYFFILQVYPTNFMPFLFDNFCRYLRFWGTSPPSPPVALPLGARVNYQKSNWDSCQTREQEMQIFHTSKITERCVEMQKDIYALLITQKLLIKSNM